MQVASSKIECSVATDKGVSRQPSPRLLTLGTPGTLPTAGFSKLKQARLLFPPSGSSPASATASASPRGKEESSKTCSPVKTSTSTEEPHQGDMMVKETQIPNTTTEEAMDVAEAGGTGTEMNTSPSIPGDLRVGSLTSKLRGDHPKTPKVKLSKAQRDALRAERERVRSEARAKREAEKLLKEQEKKERREKREQEMRERQERREQEERARREKREADQRRKEEEIKKKEEEKKRKEEERKKAEMEIEQAKEEKLRKKEQAKERFLRFFPKLSQGNASVKDVGEPEFSIFTTFPVKPGMTLAKTPQPFLKDTTNIDVHLERQNPASATYLEELRVKRMEKMSSKTEATVISDTADENDVVIVSPSPVQQVAKGKFKLLQFHTNYRPAYYGTWRQRSRIISPRNPFRKDEDLLDYAVDSDDEWEEEEPGESLSHSENEEADSGEDSEEDDSFFVPHGYLSEGEGEQSDGEVAAAMDTTDGSRKQKQLAKAKAWEAEFARRCQPIKPVQIWYKAGHDCSSRNEEFLQQFSAMALVELPISIKSSGEPTANKSHDNQANVNVESTKRCVPEEAMPELIRLVHGSAMGVGKLIKTFRMHWGAKQICSSSNPGNSNSSEPVLETPTSQQSNTTQYESASGISKRQLEIKIQSMAIKELRPNNKPVWYVHDPVLKHYNMDPQAITPLVPLVSPLSKSTSEGPKMSPETPCSSGSSVVKRGIKRKTDSTPSVKTLFEAMKDKKPVTEATCIQFKNTSPQICQTSPTFSTLTPPAKKARPNAGGTTNVSEVIVIQSDDSLESSNSTKENISANSANAGTSTAVNGQPIRLPSPPDKQVHFGALQECTNAIDNTCQEQRIDWKKLLLNTNKVHVTAEIH